MRVGKRRLCSAAVVMAAVFMTTTTALAADDPLQVVNNLSDFVFGMIRAIGGYWWALALQDRMSLNRTIRRSAATASSPSWRCCDYVCQGDFESITEADYLT